MSAKDNRDEWTIFIARARHVARPTRGWPTEQPLRATFDIAGPILSNRRKWRCIARRACDGSRAWHTSGRGRAGKLIIDSAASEHRYACIVSGSLPGPSITELRTAQASSPPISASAGTIAQQARMSEMTDAWVRASNDLKYWAGCAARLAAQGEFRPSSPSPETGPPARRQSSGRRAIARGPRPPPRRRSPPAFAPDIGPDAAPRPRGPGLPPGYSRPKTPAQRPRGRGC